MTKNTDHPPLSHEFVSHDLDFRSMVLTLSDRLVAAQAPIRILDAIQWDDDIKHRFLANPKQFPKVDSDYYANRQLRFDPASKLQELSDLERDVTRQLGQFSPVATILRRMCREYRMVIRMLSMRGKPEFGLIARELYGSSSDAFHAGEPTLSDLAKNLVEQSDAWESHDESIESKTIDAHQAVDFLQERLSQQFGDDTVRVFQSDGIIADAAAGADYIKIRRDAKFSALDLQALEVHEGQVHIATTLNGLKQPVCTFLSKGPPSSTITQEGLAVLMEVLTIKAYPSRLRRLTYRTLAIHMAESGANFCDIFAFFCDKGFDPQESYTYSARVFRGSTPDGLPFTKDIAYLKGFILVYNYFRLALSHNKQARVSLLFCGKTTLEDMPAIFELTKQGLITPAHFVPNQIQQLDQLSAWEGLSQFLHNLNWDRVEADYANIL